MGKVKIDDLPDKGKKKAKKKKDAAKAGPEEEREEELSEDELDDASGGLTSLSSSRLGSRSTTIRGGIRDVSIGSGKTGSVFSPRG